MNTALTRRVHVNFTKEWSLNGLVQVGMKCWCGADALYLVRRSGYYDPECGQHAADTSRDGWECQIPNCDAC